MKLAAACYLLFAGVASGCHVARVRELGTSRWGVVFPVGEFEDYTIQLLESTAETLRAFLTDDVNQALEACASDTKGSQLLSSVEEVLNPVTQDATVLMQGLNYIPHMVEAGVDVNDKEANLVFFKATSALSSPSGDVVRPPHVKMLDYEIEMGIVIGKDMMTGTQVTDDNVGEFIAGILLVQDFTARDIQLPQEQWTKGKSYRTFGPFGPLLYLTKNVKDVAAALETIEISLAVNGEERQRAITSDIHMKAPTTLEELSHTMDLHVGDVIMTGTPSGPIVGMGKKSPLFVKRLLQFVMGPSFFKLVFGGWKDRPWLKEGDVVQSTGHSSDGQIQLGVMTNHIKEAHYGDKDWPAPPPEYLSRPVNWKHAQHPLTFLAALIAFGVLLGFMTCCCCCRGKFCCGLCCCGARKARKNIKEE